MTRSEKTKSNVLKLIVLVTGILSTLLVLVVQHMGEILDLLTSFRSCSGGPLLGFFTLGMLFPRVNAKGAFYGGITGMVALLCLNLPARYFALKNLVMFPTKPLSIDGCLDNSTAIFNTTKATIPNALDVPVIFKVSFYYYTMIGSLVTMVVGLAISYLTTEEESVDKSLISPRFHFLLPKTTKNQNFENNKLMEENPESL